jgi:NitT/TauT family transport system substrate-binding protein
VLPLVVALASLSVFASGCGKNATESPGAGATSGPALKIAYSDWPGWLVWEIAKQKGFFKDAGVSVELSWYTVYGKSIDAFAAGQEDAVLIVCGDALVPGASGKPSAAILLTDYSDGNDMIIGEPGLKSIKDLKGKKVGLEQNLVEHLLLNKALEDNGLSDADVTVVNMETEKTPETLKSGKVDAIGAWYPISGATLEQVAGSRRLYSSKEAPGLIFDALQVSRPSLDGRRDDWKKVVGVWFRCLDFLNNKDTHDEAVRIMAGRIEVEPKVLEGNLKGTHLLDRDGNLKAMQKGDTLESVYGSLKYADKFYLRRKVYDNAQKVETYVDPSFVKESTGRK